MKTKVNNPTVSRTTVISFLTATVFAILLTILLNEVDTGINHEMISRQTVGIRFVGLS